MSVLKNKFFYLLLITAVTFSACKKDKIVSTPVAGVMAFNLIPDSTQPVVFVVDNNSITNSAISFNNYTGGYLPVNIGPRKLGLYQMNSNQPLDTAFYTFENGKYYSVFAMGRKGSYMTRIVSDKLDSLPTTTGNAFVRYVNGIPDSSAQTITITANGSEVLNTNTSLGDVSGFTGIAPGDITINVNNDSTISTNKTITLEKDKVYTLLLTGIPNATDTAKAVKVHYIINGTVTQ
jgi:hypothetical protein